MSSILSDFVTGAVFGSALTASGVYKPSVIFSQMHLQNFHMLEAFLSASATSALIVRVASHTDYCSMHPRPPSSVARLPPYVGNVLGGLLVGTGMALTGACPGTVVVQGAVSIPSGLYVGLGGLLGGILYVKIEPSLRNASGSSTGPNSKTSGGDHIAVPDRPAAQPAYTVHEKFGFHANSALLAYEAICILILGISIAFAPNDSTYFNPILGGLFIGGAQAFSVLLSRKTLGISTAYEQLGQAFWGLVLPSSQAAVKSYAAVRFAVGVILGAKALATYMPLLGPIGEVQEPSKLAAVVGGAVMVFGARLAGGCTSGHGISGMATMSLASFVTVGAMFAGGIGLSLLMR